MKIILMLLIFTPFCYATEPVNLSGFINSCETDIKAKGVNVSSCGSYLFGFLDSAKLSMGKSCTLPKTPDELLTNLKSYIAVNESLGKKHFNLAIWEVLQKQCEVSH